MPLSSISTNYLHTALLPAVRQAQDQLAKLEIELTTGEYADLGLQLGTQSGYEMSLRTQDDLLSTMRTANGITSTNLSSTQTALSTLQSAAQKTAASLLTWTPSTGGGILQTTGKGQLQQLLSVGNTTAGSGFLFGGQNSGVAPFGDFYSQPTSSAKSELAAAFQYKFGFPPGAPQCANIPAKDMQDFLSGPFAAQFQGSNWTTNWSTASSVNSSAEIAPGQTAETNTNANTPAFQQLAMGYAMLSEYGNIGLSADAQQAVATAAMNAINQGSSALTVQEAGVGVVQAQISEADDHMQSQMQVLQQQLTRTDAVDGATVATELTTLTNQLQAAYQLTAKLNSMNLAQYLPA